MDFYDRRDVEREKKKLPKEKKPSILRLILSILQQVMEK